jgi:hypothetical protein
MPVVRNVCNKHRYTTKHELYITANQRYIPMAFGGKNEKGEENNTENVKKWKKEERKKRKQGVKKGQINTK